jgi:hypothetical protein
MAARAGHWSRFESKVFIARRQSTCDECGEELGRNAWIMLTERKEVLCLSCADLDHLEFLPAGDTALSSRARKHSTLCAVVLKWSRGRKRYQRQGILVERAAIERAERECLVDAEARARARARAAEVRARLDQEYVRSFARRVRELFPGCPGGREDEIAEHACRKHSGRVGRSQAAKRLDPEAVYLAVRAHVRHRETDFGLLLARGTNRRDARAEVARAVREVMHAWGGPEERDLPSGGTEQWRCA